MTKEEAIKYLQQLYPQGGHCRLDEQRIEAISMAVKALQEEPVSIWHDANKRPQKSGVKTAWITNEKVFYSGWYNKSAFGHEDMRDSIVKFEFDKIRKWCYLDDLLNTD